MWTSSWGNSLQLPIGTSIVTGMKHIVIAGGGFAGIRLVRQLRNLHDIRITLINESDDFRYSPALYRAATGFKLGTARLPIEWMLLDSSNTSLVVGSVESVDRDKRVIKLAGGEIVDYDYVVFALGSVTTHFDIQGLEENSFGVKTTEEVLELKHHIHDGLTGKSVTEQNFVIVGAGPTGVELAGALGSYLKRVSTKHKLRQRKIAIYLVEAGPRILPQMSEKVSQIAHNHLERLNVQVLTDTMIKSGTAKGLKTSHGRISTDNVVWTAGTVNNPFFKNQEPIFKFDDRGKVLVDDHLQVESRIYVCGDNASTEHSGLALVAIRHANFIAKDITARLHHKRRHTHKDRFPVQVIPAGEKWAVLRYKGIEIHGRLISLVRKMADIQGYTDVLGVIRAMTIWQNGGRTEEECTICRG